MTDISEYKKFLWEIAEFAESMNDELDKRIDALRSLIAVAIDKFEGNKDDFIKVTPAKDRKAHAQNTFDKELNVLIAKIESIMNANPNNDCWTFGETFFLGQTFSADQYRDKIIEIYKKNGYHAYYSSLSGVTYITRPSLFE